MVKIGQEIQKAYGLATFWLTLYLLIFISILTDHFRFDFLFCLGEYVKRNFARWAKQYEASKTQDIAAMDQLMTWLGKHFPANEMTTLTHGDFRLGYFSNFYSFRYHLY
jgi:hypothetical protein